MGITYLILRLKDECNPQKVVYSENSFAAEIGGSCLLKS